MGKRLRQQRRGKGSIHKTPSHRSLGRLSYPSNSGEVLHGRIIDLTQSVMHNSPLMVVEYTNGDLALMPAPFGVRVGQNISMGDTTLGNGNVMMLKDLPAGTMVFNLERVPGDGGKYVRTSGAAAQVVGKEGNGIAVKLPSKKKIVLHERCFATVGTIAGAGRTNKPFVRAGNKFYAMKARGLKYPKVRGAAMNAVDHPHGGTRPKQMGMGKYSTTVPRNLPPGKKVGHIAARRTGKKK
ncbi:MAG: 50S ribosomal protein L2 [Candidatus Nanoarchaeia archaeon]|jgi:large subunit ribosomal protein L2|nr:50S ribosomal protein L2 [Candidatus Nanoarchaeia archaeon]|tara:strand:+ start:800 stop:1516 length:717 start_codon:yes stop_codon:yes gene_type:complete